MALNEEAQCDVRMPVRLVGVPDSVTVITTPPRVLNVSLRAKGQQRLRLMFTSVPELDIDFKSYRSRDRLRLDQAELTALTRATLSNPNVMQVSPDSINLVFTTRPGLRLPARLDCNIALSPQYVMVGKPRLSVDSVMVFSASRIPQSVRAILTEELRIDDVDRTTTRRVKFVAPNGCRVVPDSADITVEVEPLIMKTRKIVIEPIGVPEGIKLITFPAQIDVMYMMPMSVYKNSDPQLRVVADYRDISSRSNRVRLRILDVPDVLRNVHLSSDSAEYIIERL